MRPMRSATTASLCSALWALLITTGCAGGGASGGPTEPAGTGGARPPVGGQPQPSTGVVVTNNEFTPGDATVPAGTTVTWRWDTCTGGDGYGGGQTCVAHNVTFDGGGPNSATQSSGSFARPFPARGTYPYHCTVHGPAMAGRVVVQ